MGERLELDDPKLREVIQLFDEFFRKTSGNIWILWKFKNELLILTPFRQYITSSCTLAMAKNGKMAYIEKHYSTFYQTKSLQGNQQVY